MHVSQTFAEVIRGACVQVYVPCTIRTAEKRLNLTSADLSALRGVVVEINAKLIRGRKKDMRCY